MADVKACPANGARRKCERLSEWLYDQPVAAEMINHVDQGTQTRETRGRWRPGGWGSVLGGRGAAWGGWRVEC